MPLVIFLFILITCLLDILYGCCEEKFCLGLSWELKGDLDKIETLQLTVAQLSGDLSHLYYHPAW